MRKRLVEYTVKSFSGVAESRCVLVIDTGKPRTKEFPLYSAGYVFRGGFEVVSADKYDGAYVGTFETYEDFLNFLRLLRAEHIVELDWVPSSKEN